MKSSTSGKAGDYISGFFKSCLLVIVVYSGWYIYFQWIEQPYKDARIYEKWGLYTRKLTLEQWNHRVMSWNPTRVHELLGTPIEEKSRIPEIEFLWKYKLPLTSQYEPDVVTDKFVYVWFMRAAGEDRFYCIGMVDHFPN